MAKLKIIEHPNPNLERVSQEVQVPLSIEDIQLIKDMFETVQEIGIGLAAPQVNINKQIFIVHLSEDQDLKQLTKNPDFVVINPKILFYSQKRIRMIEGCLSFPNQYWENERPENVKVKYTTIYNLLDVINTNAEPKYGTKEVMLKNWISRVFQHEYDHLYGKLFVNMGGKQIDIEELKGDERIID